MSVTPENNSTLATIDQLALQSAKILDAHRHLYSFDDPTNLTVSWDDNLARHCELSAEADVYDRKTMQRRRGKGHYAYLAYVLYRRDPITFTETHYRFVPDLQTIEELDKAMEPIDEALETEQTELFRSITSSIASAPLPPLLSAREQKLFDTIQDNYPIRQKPFFHLARGARYLTGG